jgi:transcriptional regulator GlxA family with amidase domain
MERPHRIVIIGFPPAQMLDIAGPIDVLSVANGNMGDCQPYEIVLAAPHAGQLATSSGISLFASHGLLGEDLDADTLIVTGGRGARAAVRDGRLIGALDALCCRVRRVASICTGAFPLAATGALDGRRATTHWAHLDEFGALFPKVAVDRDALYVTDGKYHSSAGISAGVDFTLSLVEQDLGREIALQVARELVVFLKRPGGQSQFSAELAAQIRAAQNDRFSGLIRWIGENLSGDLSVEALARQVAMSPRNFTRRFAETMQATPAHFVQLRRIDAARQLLTDGDLAIAEIARLCGFPSADAMCLAFHRQLNVTPRDFRDRFRTSAVKA